MVRANARSISLVEGGREWIVWGEDMEWKVRKVDFKEICAGKKDLRGLGKIIWN